MIGARDILLRKLQPREHNLSVLACQTEQLFLLHAIVDAVRFQLEQFRLGYQKCDSNDVSNTVQIAMEKRLSRLPGNYSDTFGTFVLDDEGHTLGNALVSVISEYPSVRICGHTVPHPTEKRVHLTIQTTGENVIEVLKRGLHDLEKMCDHTLETFDKAYEKYKASQDVSDAT